MNIATVKYQIATYSGTIKIPYNDDRDDDWILAKAKKILRQKSGPFPFGFQSWKITERNII